MLVSNLHGTRKDDNKMTNVDDKECVENHIRQCSPY